MAKKFGTDKDVKALITKAKSQQWNVRMTGKSHIQFIPPEKTMPIIHHSLTSSDIRAYKNLQSRLRRSGLKLEH